MAELTSAINSNERGATMVEYSLLVVMIAVIALIAIALAGDQVSTTFSNIADSLTTPS